MLNNDKSFFGLLSPSDYEVLKKYGTPEFEHDNSIDNLQLLLRRELSGREEVPVVWQHGGSDLLLRTPELSVKQKDHNLLVLLPVECDQTGLQIMTFRYYLGSELQMEKRALADQSCDAPEILTKLSKLEDIHRTRIDIRLVCHHQHWVYPREAGYKGGAPYFLKIMIDGEEKTDMYDLDSLMYDAVKMYPEDISFTTVSASSTIKNLKALIFDRGIKTHSPGPNGLPGGYPVILDGNGAKINLPNEISLEEAIKINEESGKLDSIEKIEKEQLQDHPEFRTGDTIEVKVKVTEGERTRLQAFEGLVINSEFGPG